MSAKKQAEFFLRQIAQVTDPSNVMLFVDVELSGNMTTGQRPTFKNVKTFLQTIEEKLPNKRRGIYSGYYWRGDDHMGNPRVSDLGLKNKPIIWDAHYFTQAVNWGSVLYQSVPGDYWSTPAFGGETADILQFASTVQTKQFVGDGNACSASYEDLREWSGRSRKREKPLITTNLSGIMTRHGWSKNTERMVRDVEYRFPVQGATYPDHGRPGLKYSVDFPICEWGSKPTNKQRDLGWAVLEYIEGSWDRYFLDYSIYQNLMKENDSTGRFDYEPLRLDWQRTHPNVSEDLETSRHEDHVHISRLARG
jgi:hypothetical protein